MGNVNLLLRELDGTILFVFSHHEPIKAYYFHINNDKYCYVGEYDGRTVIHLRIYRRGETGNLIPTKSGIFIDVGME